MDEYEEERSRAGTTVRDVVAAWLVVVALLFVMAIASAATRIVSGDPPEPLRQIVDVIQERILAVDTTKASPEQREDAPRGRAASTSLERR